MCWVGQLQTFQSNMAKWQWTEYSETMHQSKPFLIFNWFISSTRHNSGQQTNTMTEVICEQAKPKAHETRALEGKGLKSYADVSFLILDFPIPRNVREINFFSL